MNIAVADDEEVIREQIGGFIKKRDPDSNISDFAMGEELLAADKELDQRYTLKLNSILYIENRGKKMEIHTTDMEDIIETYAGMEELEGQRGDGFYRCHRGYRREELDYLYSVSALTIEGLHEDSIPVIMEILKNNTAVYRERALINGVLAE